MRRILISIFLVGFILTFRYPLFAQQWEEIKPLISTCEDIKRLLKVEGCSEPVIYTGANYQLSLFFSNSLLSERDKKKLTCDIPMDTVIKVSISFDRMIPLTNFEKDLSTYRILAVPDLPDSFEITSNSKGVAYTVTNFSTAKPEELEKLLRPQNELNMHDLKIIEKMAVGDIVYFASEVQRSAFGSECWLSDGEDFYLGPRRGIMR